MPEPAFPEHERSNLVRLRTLVFLRWAAILGQSAAVIAAVWIYALDVQFGLASLAIGASILANLVVTFLYPTTRRMSDREATLMMAFDIVQLGVLLFVTGGLNNPFALLILAPATIAATVLPLRSTMALSLLTLALISVLALWSLPLRTAEGAVLALPAVFRLGFWLALGVGMLFLAVYARQVTTEIHAMTDALLATQMALAREQKLTDLGGVVAAAAHELGTPLATIKLVAAEMIDLLDDPEMRADAALIRDQADRCRDILRAMGRAGNDDLHLRRAPFEAVVREAAEPHLARGKTVRIAALQDDRQPVILRKPEIVHALRNLIQNAVDFATAEVAVELSWSETRIEIRIRDDGPGFPPSVLARIGDPYVQRRPWENGNSRPGYDGMGLGLFIAKTLLERTGGRLEFANGGGAIVIVTWPRDRIAAPPRAALGENRPLQV